MSRIGSEVTRCTINRIDKNVFRCRCGNVENFVVRTEIVVLFVLLCGEQEIQQAKDSFWKLLTAETLKNGLILS